MGRPVIILEPGDIEIPSGILDLAEFRTWLRSPEFPQTGRIDWLQGRLEVDVAPEDLETHGSPKSAIAVRLGVLLQETRRGRVYIDRARLTCPGTDLSVEPDILVVLVETLREGHARLVPRSAAERGRYLEVEGAADLVVECVSDGSVRKDTVRLRELYHRAGVREYWLVDARADPLKFEVLLHRPGGYLSATVSADGFRRSALLGQEVRLLRAAEEEGLVFFQLDVRP
jgi:Uma2 family endonuclease